MIFVDIDLIGVPAFALDVDPETREVRLAGVNDVHQEMTGVRTGDVVGRTPRECMPPEIADAVEPRYRHCVETRMRQSYDEVLDMPAGRRWWRTTLTPELDLKTGDVVRILGIAIDITELKRLEADLVAAAYMDPLTGLASRRRYSERIGEIIDDATSGGPGFALIVVDLDLFKPVNDAYGHVVGDTVLREIATRMQAALPDAELIARIGGDEFVALVIDVTDDDLSERTAHLSEALCRPTFVDGAMIDVRASVGAAVWRPGVTADGLMSFADARMYAAKARGRRAA